MRLVRPTGRIVYLSTTVPLRTDHSFRARSHPEHHNYYSIVEELPIVDMVKHFPSDPMHLIDEGVGKKLFLTLLEDSEFKVSPFFSRRINEEMGNLAKFTPSDFARRSRAISSKFKATEWSQLERHSSPVVFRNRLSEERYLQILTFHVAVKILSSNRFCIPFNDYAKNLLVTFV